MTNKGVTADERRYGAQFIADFAAGMDSQMPTRCWWVSRRADKRPRWACATSDMPRSVDGQPSATRRIVVRALKEQADGDAGRGAATNAQAPSAVRTRRVSDGDAQEANLQHRERWLRHLRLGGTLSALDSYRRDTDRYVVGGAA